MSKKFFFTRLYCLPRNYFQLIGSHLFRDPVIRSFKSDFIYRTITRNIDVERERGGAGGGGGTKF